MIFKYLANVKTAGFELIKALVSFKPMPILYSLDLFANALFFGDPQETISSRAGKLVLDGDRRLAYVLCKILNLFQKDHCQRHIQPGEGSDELLLLDRGVLLAIVLLFTRELWLPFVGYLI